MAAGGEGELKGHLVVRVCVFVRACLFFKGVGWDGDKASATAGNYII